MGLRIATNTQSLSAQRYLGANKNGQDRALEKLASGSRINRSGDDAAGLAISEKLRADLRSMNQATRNANDGISLVQVAEGSMNEISSMLIRLRELSIQAASDTIGDTEREFVDKEVQNLIQEVDRIAANTVFNGTQLLDGTAGQLEIQVGINNVEELDRLVFDTDELVTTADNLGVGGISVTTKEDAQDNLEAIDEGISGLNNARSALGALQNRLGSTIANNMIAAENLGAANSRIRDTDMAETTSNLTRQNVLTAANISVLAQANSNAQQALQLLG